MQDDFRPPDHYTPLGKFAFRASGIAFTIVVTSVLGYFLAPYVWTYLSLPFGDWVYEIARSWTGEPYTPR